MTNFTHRPQEQVGVIQLLHYNHVLKIINSKYSNPGSNTDFFGRLNIFDSPLGEPHWM